MKEINAIIVILFLWYIFRQMKKQSRATDWMIACVQVAAAIYIVMHYRKFFG